MYVLTVRENSMPARSGEGNQESESYLVPLPTKLLIASLWIQESKTGRGRGHSKVILSQTTALSFISKCTGFGVRIPG
jgi:hypothetical protein